MALKPNFLIVELCSTFPPINCIIFIRTIYKCSRSEIVSDFNKNLVLVQFTSSEIFTDECFKYSVSRRTANSLFEYFRTPVWSELLKVISPTVPPVNPKLPDIWTII